MLPECLRLSREEEVSVPASVVADLQLCHLDGIRFLYKCYVKELKGAILNQEDGMNFPIQISAFLRAIARKLTDPILIIAPESALLSWHYHLVNHGKFLVTLLDEQSKNAATLTFKIPELTVILVSTSDLNLLKYLSDWSFSVTAIDAFDEVARRLIVKKIRGKFNVGLTCRNFMLNPDSNLLWKMLHWCDPDAIGKISRFVESGFDDEYNLCDPYCDYWMRMTRHYCENFETESAIGKEEYLEKLKSWAEEYNLSNKNEKEAREARKRGKKRNSERKLVKVASESEPTAVENAGEIAEEVCLSANDDSSCDTIISDNDYSEYSEYVKLPSMDENPILSSIIKNLECSDSSSYGGGHFKIKSPSPAKTDENIGVLSFLFDAPSTSKTSDSFARYEEERENDGEDILSSIIAGSRLERSGEGSDIDAASANYDFCKQKEKILSQLGLDDDF